jgi:exonuclease III
LNEQLETDLHKSVIAAKAQTIETGGLSRQTKQGLRTRNGNYKIGTWNIRSLLQPGKMQEAAEEIIKYNVDIAVVQEIRWKGTGQIRYSFYYRGLPNRQGYKGVGFYVTKQIRNRIMGFEPVTERICSIRIKGKFYNTTIINIYAPTEDDSAEEKEMFYEELQKQMDKISNYDMIIVIGDANAKIGKEQIYTPTIGKFSQHDIRSLNEERLCSFAAGNNMVIASKYFKHKQIHQGTWKILGYVIVIDM